MKDRIPVGLDRQSLHNAHLFANRRDALASWPKNSVVAEVGVGAGAFSAQIIEAVEPKLFDAYDLFMLHKIEMIWGKPSAELFRGKTQRKFYEDRFSKEILARRLRVFEGDSSTQLAACAEGFYDIIYIDGNHSLAGVQKDSMSAIRAVKKGGLLVFNDYIVYDKSGSMYGVVHVVNDLCINRGWEVKYLALQAEMFCDIGIVQR